jgi:hypothetical protein
VNRTLILMMAFMLLGCSARDLVTERDDDSARLPLNYFEDQQRCMSSWRNLIAEWRDHGGRVYGTIEETRQKLEADVTSQLANIFRDSWVRQLEDPHAAPGHVFASVAESYVPADCAAFSWLGELLVSVDGVMSEAEIAELTSQAAEIEDDQAPLLGVWVVEQLLPVNEPVSPETKDQ